MIDVQLFTIETNKNKYTFSIEPKQKKFIVILKTSTNQQFTISTTSFNSASDAYEQVINSILSRKEVISKITTSTAQELLSTIAMNSVGNKYGLSLPIDLA